VTVVLAPASALIDELGALPPGMELELLGDGEPPAAEHLAAEVIVFGFELRHLVPRFGDLPHLRLVQTLNAGVEMILPHVPAGVTLCNASGVHDIPVAEWVVAVILASRRGLDRFVLAQQRREWDMTGNALTTPPEQIPFDDLDGARVLIVGYGSIGRRVESLLTPFGVRVERLARHQRPGTHPPEDLDALLPTTDVLVIMAPLTDDTRGMIGAHQLGLLPDGALVVNGARGAIIAHAALERELRRGRLHAALDATDPEPLPPDSSLWDAPNLLITPHTAGSSRRWLQRAYRFAGDQLRRHAAGEPLLNVRTEY